MRLWPQSTDAFSGPPRKPWNLADYKHGFLERPIPERRQPVAAGKRLVQLTLAKPQPPTMMGMAEAATTAV
jgi:hypothetical protein